MTDIEQKALALLNEVRKGANPESEVTFVCRDLYDHEALCRAIEQHEAFRQEVSDAVWAYFQPYDAPFGFQQFIISKPKPDPLAEVLRNSGGVDADICDFNEYAEEIRAALEARGLEIREKNDGQPNSN
jgi:hypothetical protein